ncbi:MAG: GGDEF domain-containing protein [Bradyrhizobium sp.]|nr:GGDEF domain-containing protein [Bradyrhizobium sp.]
MPIPIETQRDVLRYTGRRVLTAALLAVLMLTAMLLVRFGDDLRAPITVGEVFDFDLFAGVFISVTVCALLTYRSGLLMMELTRARRELASISQTDQLTGLFNRRGFNEAATNSLQVAMRDGAAAAVFMCDIDHFKSINDRFGHEIGDHVLAAVADVLRQFAVRHGAVTGRYGGEEFAAVMVGVSHAYAARCADDIRRACREATILDGKIPLPVTISIGFTVATGPFDLLSLMRIADSALYSAKRDGRDRVVQARAA